MAKEGDASTAVLTSPLTHVAFRSKSGQRVVSHFLWRLKPIRCYEISHSGPRSKFISIIGRYG